MIEMKQQEGDGYLLVEVAGEIDLATSPQLREYVLSCFDKKGQHVIVSLGGVTHIDSSGMATLVEGMQKARNTKGQLLLTEMDEHVNDLFKMTHLDQVFVILPTRDDAAAHLAQNA